MDQMKELNELLDNIITCGENIARLGRALKEGLPAVTMNTQAEETAADVPAEVTETYPAEETAKEETPAKTYSFADVRKTCSALSHKGHTAKVKELISKYGAAKLSEIREEDYPALMADLEVI